MQSKTTQSTFRCACGSFLTCLQTYPLSSIKYHARSILPIKSKMMRPSRQVIIWSSLLIATQATPIPGDLQQGLNTSLTFSLSARAIWSGKEIPDYLEDHWVKQKGNKIDKHGHIDQEERVVELK